MFYVVLLAAMQVNRLLMNRRQRARKIHFANHFRLSGHINNDKVIAGYRPQAHRIRRVSLLRPVIMLAGTVQVARLRQPRAQILYIRFAELICR